MLEQCGILDVLRLDYSNDSGARLVKFLCKKTLNTPHSTSLLGYKQLLGAFGKIWETYSLGILEHFTISLSFGIIDVSHISSQKCLYFLSNLLRFLVHSLPLYEP